jgi:quercetin dioxygenase-like cupin family protein
MEPRAPAGDVEPVVPDDAHHHVRENRSMKNPVAFLAVALAVGFTFALIAPKPAQTGIKRTHLQRHDLVTPGREVIQVRVELAPGVSFGRHSHPGEEAIYMLEGTLRYEIDGMPNAVTLNAGDVLFIPAGVIHAASNPGTVPGAELATYIVDKSKPLLTMAK